MAAITPSPELASIRELLDLTHKTAIVTGGAKGIGWGIARRLAEAGAAVVVADADAAAAEEARMRLEGAGRLAHAVTVDVASEADVKSLFDYAKREAGGLDILVNNAGIFPQAPIRRLTAEVFDRVVAVNLRGVFLCTKLGAELMIEQGRGGRIVNVTSIDALHPSSIGLAHYDASKHGAWGFTKSAALEYAPHGITVNAIAPGGITTPGVAAMQAGGGEEMLEAFLERIPMRRMGEPDDIGKVALFLASELSSYMTGAQIVVDGGALLA